MRLVIGVSLLALTGCINDDADGVFVTAAWTFRSTAANTPLPCPDGFGVVVLNARATNGASCNGSELVCSQPLDCALGTGTSRRLLPAAYDVWLDVTNEQGDVTYASTTRDRIDLTLGDKSYARQIVVDGGMFAVAWTLRAGDGSPRSCEQARVTDVAIAAYSDADPSAVMHDTIDCQRGMGYSLPYAAGSYVVSLEAVTASGQSRGQSAELSGQVIVAPNGITDLGIVDVMLSSTP